MIFEQRPVRNLTMCCRVRGNEHFLRFLHVVVTSLSASLTNICWKFVFFLTLSARVVEAGRSADLDGCRGTDSLLTQVWPGGGDLDDVGNNDYLHTKGSNPLDN